MAEVNAKDLTTKTAPASTDSMLLFGTTTNEGAKITVDNLADNILSRLATKTFPNQVGGSSAATILAQLATLNSNLTITALTANDFVTLNEGYTIPDFHVYKQGKHVFGTFVVQKDTAFIADQIIGTMTTVSRPAGNTNSFGALSTSQFSQTTSNLCYLYMANSLQIKSGDSTSTFAKFIVDYIANTTATTV